MNPYINLYTDNPTDGETDGTVISTDGTAPLTVVFNTDGGETYTDSTTGTKYLIIPLAVRCESGYTTSNMTEIGVDYTAGETWSFSKIPSTFDSNWSSALYFYDDEMITDVNTCFYARIAFNDGAALASYSDANLYIDTTIFPEE